MIRLAEPPQLVWPTVDVRVSYLVGEQADCMLRGTPTQWLEAASDDFAGFVAARRGVQIRWGLPSHGLLVCLRRVLPGHARRPASAHP